MCLGVLQGIQSHLMQLDLLKSVLPNADPWDLYLKNRIKEEEKMHYLHRI